ncbi:MAG: ATP-binding cassette domain-containing protein [Vicinamibacterales bacterium]
MSAIDVRDIRKQFGAFTAVDGISFAVQPGEIFGLLGPNGAGKSTLIRMLTTLLPPSGGTALVGGHDIVAEADGVRRAIGVIPQAMTSDTELSVEENLIIFAKLYGVPRDKRRTLIDQLLAAVELTEWRDKQVMYLSGGMRRRVEIARGLVHEPRIFFLDEPTTGLDPVSRVAVWDMLRRIKDQRSLTVLITTHYMDEADRLCDHIAIVDHGKLVALDSPLKLKASIRATTLPSRPASATHPPTGSAGSARCPTPRRSPATTTSSASRPPTVGHRGAGGRGRRGGCHRALAGGQEHHARRRVRPLHRPRPA